MNSSTVVVAATSKLFDLMVSVLSEWCEREGLPFDGEAHEMLRNPKLTDEQREFLHRYCELWDVANV